MTATSASPLVPFLSPGEKNALITGQAIDRILLAVRQHLGVEIAFVARYVEGDRQLLNVSSDLDLPMGPGYREPQENGYCWHIANGRLPELIRNPKDHPFTQQLAITDFLPVGCHLNVPLRLSDGTLYGSFCALSRTPDRSMTERDLGVLRAFAALATEHIEGSLEEAISSERTRKAIGDVIRDETLSIVHQPIHSLVDNRPSGVECLARFPDAKLRGPDKWFADADRVGLGIDFDMHVVRRALATLPYVPLHCYMSVNVSPQTVLSGALEAELAEGDRDRLVVELTEHNAVADYAHLARALARIAPRARIAIDDVGAGYAGLRHIVDLAPDILKLDMGLTRNVHTDPARRALVGAMVGFAGEIGAKLVAEGIECREERDLLAALGVTYGQGWFYQKPLPLAASQEYLLQAYAEGVSKPLPFAEQDQLNGEDRAA